MPSVENHSNDNPRQPPQFLAVGRVIRPHGVRGGLKVAADSDLIHSLSPATEIFLGSEKASVSVQEFRTHRKEYLLFVEGCNNRNAAEAWRGAIIFIRFEQSEPLAEDVYYHWQIIGLEVVTVDDKHLGEIVEILETGANDVYIVRDPSDKEIMLPAIESVVQDVDLKNGRMIVRLIPGLVD